MHEFGPGIDLTEEERALYKPRRLLVNTDRARCELNLNQRSEVLGTPRDLFICEYPGGVPARFLPVAYQKQAFHDGLMGGSLRGKHDYEPEFSQDPISCDHPLFDLVRKEVQRHSAGTVSSESVVPKDHLADILATPPWEPRCLLGKGDYDWGCAELLLRELGIPPKRSYCSFLVALFYAKEGLSHDALIQAYRRDLQTFPVTSLNPASSEHTVASLPSIFFRDINKRRPDTLQEVTYAGEGTSHVFLSPEAWEALTPPIAEIFLTMFKVGFERRYAIWLRNCKALVARFEFDPNLKSMLNSLLFSGIEGHDAVDLPCWPKLEHLTDSHVFRGENGRYRASNDLLAILGGPRIGRRDDLRPWFHPDDVRFAELLKPISYDDICKKLGLVNLQDEREDGAEDEAGNATGDLPNEAGDAEDEPGRDYEEPIALPG